MRPPASPRGSGAEALDLGSTPRWPRPSSPRRVSGARQRYDPKHIHSHRVSSPSTSEGPPAPLLRAMYGDGRSFYSDFQPTLGTPCPRSPLHSRHTARMRNDCGWAMDVPPKGPNHRWDAALRGASARKDESLRASAPPFHLDPTPASLIRDLRGLGPPASLELAKASTIRVGSC